MAYLDDVLVFSRMQKEHFRHLQIVFDRLREHGLRLKLLKCQFLKRDKISGVCNRRGMKPDIDKVEVIKALPKPTMVRQVRGFIGAIGYYRRFIPAFSHLAGLLIALTLKYASGWKTVSELLTV